MASPDRLYIPERREVHVPRVVKVAGNLGFCGGVRTAVEEVELELSLKPEDIPLFTNWDPIHNKPTVEDYERQGLTNVRNDLSKVTAGSKFFVSAHGGTLELFEAIEEMDVKVRDLTCILVDRVYRLVKRACDEGKYIVYLGKKGHPETEGVMSRVRRWGEGQLIDVEEYKGVIGYSFPETQLMTVFSQTTLSPSDVEKLEADLREKFEERVEIPPRMDICPATLVRQQSAKGMVEEIDFLLVIGSQHSHNSQELRRLGDLGDIPARSIDTVEEIDWRTWFEGVDVAGLTAGASVKDALIKGVISAFESRGSEIEYLAPVVKESAKAFKLRASRL